MMVMILNGSGDFTVSRMPEAESAGYPFLARIRFDGRTVAERVTKTGLMAMRREISHALKDAS
ncbi:hypothetical protein EMO89_01505 [Bifidobacterium tissieri]|uniref:Uncharacterized protein n=1 Tax=Bifidobacterium tissieri TaxID=1630162 RepID=A0A5M9ZV51_9BIFI|nr:hypothetical protein [Bifidobacterium tissieri]KAA8831440.1 hypothetical protein EMO89_01505 [Bifidobacterium tissieri]